MTTSRARNWCFTLNNYDEGDIPRLLDVTPQVRYILFGVEVGENGTPHLQGFISFFKQTVFSKAKEYIGNTAHLEVCRNVNASIEYCKKDGVFHEAGKTPCKERGRSDLERFKSAVNSGEVSLKRLREDHSDVFAKYPRFCIDYLNDHIPEKAVELHPLREWQVNLKILLDSEPDDRTVYFVVDHAGNQGKSWFAHYYSSITDNCQVMQPGKKADMAYALDQNVRTLIIDAPRSKQGEFIQYDFIEDVKNGYVFSPKYESRTKQLSKAHVVVMMNEPPDMTKLSADRYALINLS